MAEIYLDADVDAVFAVYLRGAGNLVLITAELGRRRAYDEEQLAFAAQRGLILVTHNADDYLLLQRAWRHWADRWSVDPRPVHAGILAVPQVLDNRIAPMAQAINEFIRSGVSLQNRYYVWIPGRDWVQKG
ncbi:MAG TPA: DUF5615 family PIN-like protein [Thermomicrobiales bacterium]|jgi:hypothetical protein